MGESGTAGNQQQSQGKAPNVAEDETGTQEAGEDQPDQSASPGTAAPAAPSKPDIIWHGGPRK